MIFSIQEQLEPIAFITAEELQHTPQGALRPLRLVIYRAEVTTTFSHQVTKRLSGIFYDAEEKEIPSRQWTPEMKQFFHERKQQIKLSPGYFRLTWKGWLLALIGIVAIVGLTTELVKIVDDGSGKEAQLQTMAKEIKPGDLYFGYYFSDDRPYYAWASVTERNDSTISIRLSKDHRSNDSKTPADYSHEAFEETEYHVVPTVQYQILSFTTPDYTFSFIVTEKK